MAKDPRKDIQKRVDTAKKQLRNSGLNASQRRYLDKEVKQGEKAIGDLTKRQRKTGSFEASGKTVPPLTSRAGRPPKKSCGNCGGSGITGGGLTGTLKTCGTCHGTGKV